MSKDTKPKSPAVGRSSAKNKRALAAATAAMAQAASDEPAEVKRTKPAKAPKARKPDARKPKPSTREGKKGLVLYVQPEISLALRKLALEHDSDVQQMGRRALELLFAEYGRSLPGGSSKAAGKS